MVLEKIKKILEDEDFECALTPASKAFPVDQLRAFLTLDNKKRERILEIFGIQLASKEASLPCRLHFQTKLPFKVQDNALGDVAFLLHYVNQLIDLPGFELNELEGAVLYRYVWIIEENFITSSLILSIFGSFMMNLGLFADMIESVAEGKVSFNALLEEIVKVSEASKPPSS